jgi:hypothetical protein
MVLFNQLVLLLFVVELRDLGLGHCVFVHLIYSSEAFL